MFSYEAIAAPQQPANALILSKTARYALRALVYLAEARDEAPIRVDRMAEDLKVPRNYLSKILHTLTRREFLTSSRGPRGGFSLSRPAESVRLVDVVREFDAFDGFENCLLGRAECRDSDPCAAHEGWKRVQERVETFLERTSVADLAAGKGLAG